MAETTTPASETTTTETTTETATAASETAESETTTETATAASETTTVAVLSTIITSK